MLVAYTMKEKAMLNGVYDSDPMFFIMACSFMIINVYHVQ